MTPQLLSVIFQDELAETQPCDQIYTMNADGSNITLVSPGTGRDTCSYFYPDGTQFLLASLTN